MGPFSSNGSEATGYVVGGIEWYRKHFKLDKSETGKTVILKFNGIFMNSEVWINGISVGSHPYGFTPFWFDITPYLNQTGEENVIAVKVNNTGYTARWYSGSGIYRNVHLTITDPVHFSVWGAYITTPEVSIGSADVNLEVTLQNDADVVSDAHVSIKIISPGGNVVEETEWQVKIGAKEKSVFSQAVVVKDPLLWSVNSPNLYEAEMTVKDSNGKITDRYVQTFGIRSIEFSAKKGFLLNGEPLLIKGGCVHHDNGLLGSAAIDRAEERRVEIMKANGYNAIRCSHNPPSEAFLNACDRLGILVINEIFDVWEKNKFMPQGSHLFFKEYWKKDVEAWVLRDRNHPSVIMWSIGNEIGEAADTSGLRIATNLVNAVRSLDSTRAITEVMTDAGLALTGVPTWHKQSEHKGLLDVVGYNYKYQVYEEDHKLYPDRIMYASESSPFDAYESWQAVEKSPWVIGDFVWTGMDYLDESGIAIGFGTPKYFRKDRPNDQMLSNYKKLADKLSKGEQVTIDDIFNWPNKIPAVFVAWCGDIYITGEMELQMYYKNILWGNSNLG
nr:glycoside hydrolase family 2 TIM barrel-domain containing protein [uncultured Draconibacterium sp.]